MIHTDVFIAGAGAAGIGAAVAAAEAGIRVCIAEKNSYPGGRATASAVGTICGLYLRSNELCLAMKGFPENFAAHLMTISGKGPVKYDKNLWFLPSHPDDFEKTAMSFLAHEKINCLFDTRVISAEYSPDKITTVRCIRNGESLKIIPRCVIDCSGEAVVCAEVKHQVISDKKYQAGAIVFSVKDFKNADEYQLGFSLLKKIAGETAVPSYFNLVSIIPYSLSGNSVLLKMGLPWEVTGEHSSALQKKSEALVQELFAFIKSSVAGFENASIEWIAREAGIRTGVRAKGKTVLKDKDVLSCTKPEDGICHGAWPVEYWHTGNKRVEMTYFKDDDYYSIPAGCLESEEKENLFFGGKIISAEEKAIASARVIGTCLGTGYAAGILASYKVQNKSRQEAIDFLRRQTGDSI